MLDDLNTPKPCRDHGPDDCPRCDGLPTDAELDAMAEELRPCLEEFNARQLAAQREEY